jgi:hypothetical protein
MPSKKKINPASETIAACIRGTLADAQAIQKAAKVAAASQGKALELREPTPEDVGEVIPLEAWPTLFKMAKQDAREAVRAVIEGKKTRDEITAGKVLFSMVENYIIATARGYGEGGRTFTEATRKTAGEIAKILEITPAAMRKFCADLQKKIEADSAQYFPEMKPTPADVIRTAGEALNETALQTITQQFLVKQPKTHEVFSHWKGDVYLPFMQDEAKGGQWQKITISEWKDSAGKEVDFSIKYPPGVGCITPFDQVVENALSRLFLRYNEEQRDPGGLGFTLEQIFCEMAGNANAARPSKPMLDKIYSACEKLRHTEINCTASNKDGGRGYAGYILKSDLYWITPKRGKTKIGYKVLDEGLLTSIEKSFWDPLNIPAEVLNIGEGENAVSITETSLVICRFLMQDIFRIKKTEYLTPESRTISLARIIDYEASEALTEYQNDLPIILEGKPGKPPRHQLKQTAGASPQEKNSIKKAKKHRRELAGRILAHFVETGFIKAARLNEDKTGFIIDVEKTEKAAKRIEHKDRQTKKIKRLAAAADRESRKKGGPEV